MITRPGLLFVRRAKAGILLALLGACGPQVGAADAKPDTATTPRLDRLDILRSDWPRAFFFRSAELKAVQGNVSYEAWLRSFARLQGIAGKVLDEEAQNRARRNIDFFTRFKAAQPRQIVLEHYNGFARLPDDAPHFFAGHWVYYNGCRLPEAVAAVAGESEFAVPDTRLFKLNTGRLSNANDDIGLCELDAVGRPDWSRSEQVKLLAITKTKGQAGLLRVQRGQYGTAPRAFAPGKAYAAAHMGNGPWGKDPQFLWVFNFATTCPRDAQGRNCSAVLLDEMAELFGPAGKLSAFDGLEFDVMRHSLTARRELNFRAPDADADGAADGGYVGGEDVYGAGTQLFCRELRRRLGPDRLILVDGWSTTLVRAFDALSGMESEGWPRLGDATLADWCGGLNRAAFWSAHSATPRFNYINHKLVEKDADRQPGYAYHRLVFAGALFTDFALCSTLAPPVEGGELFGVWDEFWCGTEQRLGWLGQPRGPARHLAFTTPDLLAGAGAPVSDALLARVAATASTLTRADAGLRIAGKDAVQPTSIFTLTVPVAANGELLVRFTVQAAPSALLPPNTPRALHVAVEGREEDHTTETWCEAQPMDYTFYATGLAPGEARLIFTLEGAEPWTVSALAAHGAPDAMLREYEHGLVLANPSGEPFSFDLAKLLPGQKFHRLQATRLQDTQVNNGQSVGATLTLGPRDGLFLLRE